MKKLARLALLVVVAGSGACHRTVVVQSPPQQSANTPGGVTPRDALQRFMAAAKAQDLQALDVIWGTNEGPVRSTMPQAEREQREIVMICYLKHDSYSVISEAPATNLERVFAVELKYKGLTKTTNFYVTPGPSSRWYVRAVPDLESLRDICATR